MNEYQVTLQDFEGPLDLLLHLIKEKQMDLENLEVSKITSQYLEYIHQSQSLNLEVASEYLVMASYLIELKSKSLLPVEVVDIEDEYQEDPREILIKRLIEYKKYKDVVEALKEKYETRKEIFIKPSSTMEEFIIDTSEVIPDHLEVYDLIKAMQKLYQRKVLSSPLITSMGKKEISIDECCISIKQKLENHKKIEFDDLFDSYDRHYFVVTFLAVLVLAKQNELHIYQDQKLKTIYLEEVKRC